MSERRGPGKGLADHSYWREQREAEDSFRILAEKALDFAGICNADNTFRYVNPASERVLGYKPDELVGTLVSDLLHPDDLYQAMGALAEALSTTGPVGPVVFRYRHKDGSWRYLELMANVLLDDPEVRGIVVISRDVTGRLRIEPTSSEDEEFFRLLVENALDMVLVADAEGAVRYVSRSTERVLGYRPGDIVGTELAALLHPDDAEQLRPTSAKAADERTSRPILARYRHKDDSWRWIEGKVSDLSELPGVRGVIHSGRDVTERREAEEEILYLNEVLESQLAERNEQLGAAVLRLEETERRLRDSEERFRITFEGAAIGIAHVGVDGRFLRVNTKLCEITGYTREELLARTFQDITHPKDLGADLDYARRVLCGEIETYSMEKRYLRKDGSPIWVNLTVSLLHELSGEPEHFISFVEDIDERRKDRLVLEFLTPRETEVLSHLALGKTNREIAQSLNLSESYVKLLFQEAAHKLGISNRAQAAARAVELGLLRRSESPEN